MSVYAVASYTVTNPEGYKSYGPAVAPILAAHEVEIVGFDEDSEGLEGAPGRTTVIMRFPSKEAARAFYDSDEYQAIAHFRTDNSEGSIVLCKEIGARA